MDRTRRNPTRIPLLLVVALGALALGGTGSDAATSRSAKQPSREAVPGELLIGFQAGVSAADQKQLLNKVGAIEKRKFKAIHGSLARMSPDAVAAALDQLRSDPRVRYAEPNFVLHAAAPDDPSYHRLWGLDNTGQAINGFAGTPDADIDAPEAWATTTGSSAVTVAVIDTGVDWSHPDLSSEIWANPGESCSGCATDGLDNDANGYVDDGRGWDFVGDDNNPMDDHGHGTHVAGTIGAAGNNGIGITGVNWSTRLMPVKFLDAQGSGTEAGAIAAVLYAAENGAAVLNNSWAGGDYSQALADAITVADTHGSLFVAAAGNDGSDNDAVPTYPASYDLPNVLSVAATDNSDDVAYFSNVGRRSVDLGAPGVNIYSTWPGASYQYLSGTSMATPQVSGAAALAKAAFPSAGAVGLKALLLDSVDPNASLSDLTATGGRLNAATAVTCNATPKVWLDSPAAGFVVDAGSPVSISVLATNCADSGGITVSASANGAPIELSPRGDGLYAGTYTPSARGALTISVTASVGGNTKTRTVTGNASQSYSITPGGPPVTVTTTSPDENASLGFEGQAGQRVSVAMSAVTIPVSQVSILKPDGTVLTSGYTGTAGGFVDARTLPLTGTYTLVVDPLGTGTGSMTLTLYDVPPDAAAPVTPGGAAATISNSTPGQNARVTFAGQAGQRISLKLSAVTMSLAFVSILKPDGSALVSTTYIGTAGGFIDTRTLPAAGTYTILVDPQGMATGSMTLTLYDVPADAGGPITPGWAAATVSMQTPGQNGRLTFDGRASQRISLKISSVTFSSAFVSIVRYDGTAVGTSVYVGPGGGFVDTRTLPGAGSYAIVIDPQGLATGSATLTLYDVPPDATGTLTAGGPSLAANLGTPGQNARIAFEGQAGERISLKVAPSTLSWAYLSILKPDGSVFVANTMVSTTGAFVDTRTLPGAGTYTIVLDPQGAATGSATLALYDVPADASGSVGFGGPSLTISTATPGQNARIIFDGRAGQHVSLKFSGVTVSLSYVSILKPDGGTLVAPTYVMSNGRTFTLDLPADGTYAVVIDPQGAATGSMTLSLF